MGFEEKRGETKRRRRYYVGLDYSYLLRGIVSKFIACMIGEIL